MNKKPLFPFLNPGQSSVNDKPILKCLSFGEDDPLATADSAKAQQLNKSITKGSRTVLKTYPYEKTVLDGLVVLDGTGVVAFPDNVLVFDEGKDDYSFQGEVNNRLTLRFGYSEETNSNLCVAKFGDNTFKLPNIVLFRGHLEKDTDDDEDIEFEDECDATVTVVYIAKYGILEVSYNSELPSSRAVDVLYSMLLNILLGNKTEKRLEDNE